MATIPLGNFGNAIAAPAPRPSITPAAYSGGEGLQRVADKAVQTIGGMMDEQRREQEEGDRSHAMVAVIGHNSVIESKFDEVTERISAGEIPREKAIEEFSNKLKEARSQTLSEIPDWLKKHASIRIDGEEQKASMRLSKHLDVLRRDELAGNLYFIRDTMEKSAVRAGADVEKINAEFEQAANVLGPQAGLGADKIVLMVKNFKDGNWFNQAKEKAILSRASVQDLDALETDLANGFYAKKLDPEKRNTLLATVNTYKTSIIQRNEAAAARAAHQQEVALKRAEAEFNTFQSLSDKGTIIAPEYVDRAIAATKGTPYQAGIVALAKQAQETGGIAAQPIRKQQEMLDAIDRQISQKGRTPALDKRREQAQLAIDGTRTDVKNDALRAGLARGWINDISPINISSPDSLAESLSERLKQADKVSFWADKTVSPLDANEADQVRGILEALPPKQRSAAVATIAQSVGPRYASAISEQLDSKDKALSLAFAVSGSKTTAGRFTSELILKGATAIKDGTAMKDDKNVTGWKATIAQEIDGAFPDERAATAVKEASYFIAAGIAAENGGSVGSSDLKRAVTLAIGGEIIERGGKKLPIPAGIDAGEFETRVRNYPVSDIVRQSADGKVRAGGVEISAEEFATSIPGQELIYAGPGRYAVIVKGRPATNSAGRPIIIEVR